MDGTLSLTTRTLGFSDPTNAGNDPQKRNVDWKSSISVPAKNVAGVPYTVDPGATLSLFSGNRTISADGTTQWTLTLSPLAANRYRFTSTSGTAPVLRTDRALALNTQTVIVTVQVNQTATFAANAAAFSAVQVGDTLFIPGVTTGDTAGPFNPLNEGYWTVLSVAGDGSNVQVTRGTGVTFQAFGQSVVITLNAQVQAFSGTNVQIGDGVVISAGFPTAVLGHYTVVAVAPKWFEVLSTAPLPVSSVAVPGATGILFYQRAKRYVEIWADQECYVQVNGDSGSSNKISPWQQGDITQAGCYIKAGLTFQATIVNASTSPLNIQFISAE